MSKVQKLQVIVTKADGSKQELTIDLKPTDTGSDLKKVIAETINVNITRLVLTHRDKPIRDNDIVSTFTGKNDIPVRCTVGKGILFHGIH